MNDFQSVAYPSFTPTMCSHFSTDLRGSQDRVQGRLGGLPFAPPRGDANFGLTSSNLLEINVTGVCPCGVVANTGDAPLCNVTQEFYCGAEALEDYIMDEDGRNKCDCPSQCFKRSYEVTISEAVYSNYFLDFMS